MKALLFFSGHDEGNAYLIDVISYKNALWLVSTWLLNDATNKRVPERLILMDGLYVRYQEVTDEPYQFLLSSPIPISVFRGEKQDGYVLEVYQALSDTQARGSIH